MQKVFPEYYIGLDIGTNSIGWAVTDENYQILKFAGKNMWGSRIFEEAQTAAERRNKRTMRRRLQRRRWRLDLLNDIFEEELNKKDPNFLKIRINESKLQEDEREIKGLKGLFQDSSLSDTDYYKKYPTIFHLRKDLMDKPNDDIRLLYLAIHNIIKYRGNFLYEGELKLDDSFDLAITNFEEQLNEILQSSKSEMDDSDELELTPVNLSTDQKEEIRRIISSKLKRSEKKEALINFFKKEKVLQLNKNLIENATKALCGLSANFKTAFALDEDAKIEFSKGNYDDERSSNESKLGERILFIDSLKQLYDYSIICGFFDLKENSKDISISNAFIAKYEKYNRDLKNAKYILKKYSPSAHKSLRNNLTNFVKLLDKKIFANILSSEPNEEDIPLIENIISDIDNHNFLVKPRNTDNSVIPNQLHAAELKKILDTQAVAFPFLGNCDENGHSNKDKILSLCSFKIPYFVGPLNSNSQYSWCIRKAGKEKEKILPWTFNEIIDKEKSGKEFIERLTNDCTYLKGEPVLPRYSLLYQEFVLLNELNKVKVNGQYLDQECKDKIINELFKKQKKVTFKAFTKFLNAKYFHGDSVVVTGVVDQFNASLSSWVDLLNIISEEKIQSNREILDEAIRLITIYNEDTSLLIPALHKILGEAFSSAEIERISKLKYKGWGRLSKKLLDEVEFENTETGELSSVIQTLRENNNNFMELMTAPFTLHNEIVKLSDKNNDEITITYESVMDDLNVSPALKRSIWQCIKIIEEIRKVTKKDPKKIFVEVARGEDKTKKGKKTISRGEHILSLYKDIKGDEYKELKAELGAQKDKLSSSKRIYLYFTQLGKCMYSGEAIDLGQLFTNKYDVDHIYPRSKIKDDSLNNLVLVKSELNKKKSNMVIDSQTRKNMEGFWSYLKSKKLISSKKFEHLTTAELTPEIIAGFLNRQLVTTQYSTISLIRILEGIYNIKPVYVKAGLVSEFRKDVLNYIKSRSLNDLHHAKDAYLNIIVGNVYNSIYTNNPLLWVKEEKKANLDFIAYYNRFIFNREKTIRGKCIWKPEEHKKDILKFLGSKNIQCTVRPYMNSEALYNETIYSPKDQPKFSIKNGMTAEKYGGYKSEKPAYFILLEIENKKGKKQKRIDSIPLTLDKYRNNSEKYEKEVELYLRQKLKLEDGDRLKILIPKILKNTILKVDGYNYYLVGNNDKQLLLRSEPQLILAPAYERLFEQAARFAATNKTTVTFSDSINKVEDFTEERFKEDNWLVYQELKNKYENTLLKNRINWSSTNYIDEASFKELTILEQCKLLIQTAQGFNRSRDDIDLTIIGKGSRIGNAKIGKNQLDNKKSVSLIHKSICGLYEQEIRIK